MKKLSDDLKPTEAPLRSRLAPTPSGYLHIGNAANFLLTWLLVRESGGNLLLRIDDLDSQRVRDEYLDDIFITLEWLGIDYDEGPSGVADFKKNWSQQNRLPVYQTWLQLLAQHADTYACNCSRLQIKERYPSGIYLGNCRDKKLSHDEPNCQWRLPFSMQKAKATLLKHGVSFANQELTIGDPVVRKKDGMPAYQVSSIADDIYYNINLAVRGEDLLPSTAFQLYLHELLWEKLPPISFLHHSLLTNKNGFKLSKSSGSTSLQYIRKQGGTPQLVFEQIATAMGWVLKAKSPAAAKDLLSVVSV